MTSKQQITTYANDYIRRDRAKKDNLINAGKTILQLMRHNKTNFDYASPNPLITIKDLKATERYLTQEIINSKTKLSRPKNNEAARSALCSYILSNAVSLLKNQSQVTIEEIMQASDFPEAAVRSHIHLLVDSGKLAIIPGMGHRPAYYLLPTAAVATAPTL